MQKGFCGGRLMDCGGWQETSFLPRPGTTRARPRLTSMGDRPYANLISCPTPSSSISILLGIHPSCSIKPFNKESLLLDLHATEDAGICQPHGQGNYKDNNTTSHSCCPQHPPQPFRWHISASHTRINHSRAFGESRMRITSLFFPPAFIIIRG